MKRRNNAVATIAVAWGLLGLLVALTAKAAGGELQVVRGRAMGTDWTVTFVAVRGRVLTEEQVGRRVSERLEHLEQLFSTYRPDSVLSRFNASASSDWIAVPRELAVLADEARRISALTGGTFDVTVFPLVQVWGFGSTQRSGELPGAEEISTARARVDWRRLEVRVEPPALRKLRPDIRADFSSLAKGFAADAVSELLAGLGVKQHLVQVGGDVKALGSPNGIDGWRVAIERPDEGGAAVAKVVGLAGDGEKAGTRSGQALSTSGDYRNFFRQNGRRYGHIIDPRTGEPVTHALAAVSVVHPSCATSSALATALFVLGPEEGFRVAVKERLACLFIVREGSELVQRPTPEFKF